MIVLDASVLVEMLLRTKCGEQAVHEVAAAPAHAPHLLDAEVGSVMRRLENGGVISPAAALAAMAAFAELPIQRHALAPLLAWAWELRKNATISDAVYLSLAEALGARLLTTDQRLARVPGAKVAATGLS